MTDPERNRRYADQHAQAQMLWTGLVALIVLGVALEQTASSGSSLFRRSSPEATASVESVSTLSSDTSFALGISAKSSTSSASRAPASVSLSPSAHQ